SRRLCRIPSIRGSVTGSNDERYPMRKTVFGCCASAWLSAKSTAQRVRMVNFFFMAFSMPRSTCPSTLDTRPFSFDHPVRPRQHIRWNRQADQLRCLQIDDELKLLRLLYGEIRGFGTF